MRVLVVASDFSAQGIGIAVHGICSALSSRGHEIRLLVRDSGQNLERDLKDPPYDLDVGHSVFIKPSLWPRTMKQLLSKISGIKEFAPEAVLCTDLEEAGALGIAAAKVAGVSTVAIAWGDDWSGDSEALPSRARMVIKSAEGFIPLTRFARKHIIELGFDERKCEVVLPGVDHDIFSERPRKRASVSGPLNLLISSPLEKDSGVEEAVALLQLLIEQGEDARLTLLGTGTRRTKLRQLVKEQELDELVTFTGPLRFKDLPATLRKHDILLTCPVRRKNAIARHRSDMMRIMEAASVGLATVGTQVGGIPEILKIAGGSVARSSKPEDLVLALSEAIGKETPEKVRAWDEVGLEMELLLEKIVYK
jgi:glycosyltransferase involved in cell wall biosynthesis